MVKGIAVIKHNIKNDWIFFINIKVWIILLIKFMIFAVKIENRFQINQKYILKGIRFKVKRLSNWFGLAFKVKAS
jgi:hypothetical protein